ncbi:ATP synthase subunit e, mitochondrial [Heterocephalus glaber]|uniref:ATP synthase F(0) complex subunit e, mitochondrial n=1 Tax=Heterocephalus glaber TaxID=10181 RepID=G5BCL0_HETGA|nr:ATP synthase subunit e, mitochondrial [Heterocephalus glaber]
MSHRSPAEDLQPKSMPSLGRYSALVVGIAYGTKRYSYLKPRAEEERRIAAEEKQRQDELKRIERELAEGTECALRSCMLPGVQEQTAAAKWRRPPCLVHIAVFPRAALDVGGIAVCS